MSDKPRKTLKRKILEGVGYWVFVLAVAGYNSSGWILFIGFLWYPIFLKEPEPSKRDEQLAKIEENTDRTNKILQSMHRDWLECGQNANETTLPVSK